MGVIFILSGVPKLTDPGRFYQQVIGFGLVDASASTVVAYAVPVLELGIAGCLFLGVLLGGTWVTTVILLAGFTLLHLRVVILGQEIACACFDPESTQMIGWWTVSRNTILWLISLAGLATYWMAEQHIRFAELAHDSVPR